LPDEKEGDILLLHVNLLWGIVSRLYELLNNPELKKDSYDFKKDTLIILFKTTKEAYKERKKVQFNEKISIPGIVLGPTKHYYSTWTKQHSFNRLNFVRHYSSSLTSQPKKLTINSNPESLSFIEGKAVWMLAPLLPFLRYIEDIENGILQTKLQKALTLKNNTVRTTIINLEKNYLGRFYEDFF